MTDPDFEKHVVSQLLAPPSLWPSSPEAPHALQSAEPWQTVVMTEPGLKGHSIPEVLIYAR